MANGKINSKEASLTQDRQNTTGAGQSSRTPNLSDWKSVPHYPEGALTYRQARNIGRSEEQRVAQTVRGMRRAKPAR
jgi:hypothetical protein